MSKVKRILLFLLFVVAGLYATNPPAAQANPPCGDTIGPNETVALDGDLICNIDEVLTVIGPAILNLNGHAVVCNPSDIGIRILGKGAVVKNGFVAGDCVSSNILVVGDGKHSVIGIDVDGDECNGRFGIEVKSNKNLIALNNVHDFDETGIPVFGSFNILKKNHSSWNCGDGFVAEPTDITSGSFNSFLFNYAEWNGGDGFDTEPGADGNIFTSNKANSNFANGFRNASNKNKLTTNIANGNGHAVLLGNGIDIVGDENHVKFNVTKNNIRDGIVVIGQNNTIKFNKAFDNGSFDLEDGDAACDGNVWMFNFFNTSNPGCIM